MVSRPETAILQAADHGWINLLLEHKVALWIGPRGLLSGRDDPLTAELLGAPWAVVFCHPTDPWIEARAKEGRAAWSAAGDRHSIDVIKSDPTRIELLEESTPFFFINGVAGDPDPSCRPDIPEFSRMSRRISMYRRLVTHPVDLLVIVGVVEADGAGELAVVLREAQVREMAFMDVASGSGPPPLDRAKVLVPGIEGFVVGVIRKAHKLRAGDRLDVRFRLDEQGKTVSVDLTACEAVGHPIRDRFEMILERDLHRGVLSEAEIEQFFTGDHVGWRPIAAGLPWPRGSGWADEVLGALKKVHRHGTELDATVWLETEPGAGTSTLLRQLAFQAADAGYPVLFARHGLQQFDVAEVSNFLTKVAREVAQVVVSEARSDHGASLRDTREVPWLIVFDVEHLSQSDERVLRLCERLQKAGRAAVVLCPHIPRPIGLSDAAVSGRMSAYGRNLSIPGRLRHTLEQNEALKFGQHVNSFLGPEKRYRDQDWLGYWRTTTPRLGDLWASESTFWVALHFWLSRQISLDKSIRQWLYQHFREAIHGSERLGRAILEVATVASRMKAIPLNLLGAGEGLEGGMSLGSRLDDVAIEYPSLGLRRVAKPFRGFSIAHPLLAKQLLEAVALDAEMQVILGLDSCEDVLDVEMAVYGRMVTRESIREKESRPLVNQLAQEILKVDTETNPGLSARWERAITVLEGATDGVWDTNRVFNHHVAISRRNIGRMFTHLDYESRREQYALAEEHLRWARRIPISSDGDDRDLNLVNTLGLVYDSWADLEQAQNHDEAKELRNKAMAEFRRAEELEPDNGYVVESMGSHWLRRAEEDPEQAAHHAVEALLHLEQATSLEGAEDRRKILEHKSERAYRLLGEKEHLAYLGRLRDSGSEIGYLGFAHLELGRAGVEGSSPEALDRALAILDRLPPLARSWRTYRMRYNIICRRRPLDFLDQSALMEQMIQTGMVMTMRYRLEHSILLYQVGKIGLGRDGFHELRTLLNSPHRGAFVAPPPQRLRWLRTLREGDWVVWQLPMKVVRPDRPHRAWCVPQWHAKDVQIPFSPLQFGMDKVATDMRRDCVIRFNHNGPMAVPPEDVDA